MVDSALALSSFWAVSHLGQRVLLHTRSLFTLLDKGLLLQDPDAVVRVQRTRSKASSLLSTLHLGKQRNLSYRAMLTMAYPAPPFKTAPDDIFDSAAGAL